MSVSSVATSITTTPFYLKKEGTVFSIILIAYTVAALGIFALAGLWLPFWSVIVGASITGIWLTIEGFGRPTGKG